MAIDGLLADPARGTLIAHPAGALRGGPARAETTLDVVAQPGILHQLALPGPPSIRVALRHDAPVAAELRDLAVVETVAAQLTEDRRAVPAKPARHLVWAQLHLPPALDLAALGKGKVREPNLHSYDPFMAQPIVEHRKSHFRIARPPSTGSVVTKLKCRLVRHLEMSHGAGAISRPRPALQHKDRKDGAGGSALFAGFGYRG